MKILTIATRKDVFSSLPQAEKTRLNISSYEYALELKKKMGAKWQAYGVPGWGRMVSIGEYGSLEEYMLSLQSPPAIAGFINYESYPLIEADEKTFKTAIDTLKAAK